jgi:hypothetical protein
MEEISINEYTESRKYGVFTKRLKDIIKSKVIPIKPSGLSLDTWLRECVEIFVEDNQFYCRVSTMYLGEKSLHYRFDNFKNFISYIKLMYYLNINNTMPKEPEILNLLKNIDILEFNENFALRRLSSSDYSKCFEYILNKIEMNYGLLLNGDLCLIKSAIYHDRYKVLKIIMDRVNISHDLISDNLVYSVRFGSLESFKLLHQNGDIWSNVYSECIDELISKDSINKDKLDKYMEIINIIESTNGIFLTPQYISKIQSFRKRLENIKDGFFKTSLKYIKRFGKL